MRLLYSLTIFCLSFSTPHTILTNYFVRFGWMDKSLQPERMKIYEIDWKLSEVFILINREKMWRKSECWIVKQCMVWNEDLNTSHKECFFFFISKINLSWIYFKNKKKYPQKLRFYIYTYFEIIWFTNLAALGWSYLASNCIGLLVLFLYIILCPQLRHETESCGLIGFSQPHDPQI